MAAAHAVPLRKRTWARAGTVAGLVLLVLALLLVFFPWDLLRGPVNRYVTAQTGRHFEITRRLDVQLGRTTRVVLDGITFANPEWAQDRHLLRAERAEVEVRLWPLLRGELVLPSVRLTQPQLGLQAEPDGRRTWALGRDARGEGQVPAVGALVVDRGTLHYLARHQGADIRTDFAIDPREQQADARGAGGAMPLRFQARGLWQQQRFEAEGRTGDVLYLNAPLQQPFPAEVQARAGDTRLQAHGTIASLATLEGAQVDFALEGPNLAALYRLVGLVLPDTRRYAVEGQLSRQGEAWQVRGIRARLGRTDMAGELAYDRSAPVPQLRGRLQSRLLDFEDLAPLVGLDEQPARDAARGREAGANQDAGRKVLPSAPLDVRRLRAMNADVRIDAHRVANAKGLPLDRMGVHVQLRDGVLVLDPLDLGVAGGQLAGRLRLDATARPMAVQARLDARSLELARLLPQRQRVRGSFGKLQGQMDLAGRGDSVAQLLATADGRLAVLVGRGQISNILLEIAGLDGGEVLKFLLRGDDQVQLRCAATAFDVRGGVMTSRALVLDTVDTIFHGTGRIDLARETLDFVIRPEPKDTSILSVRTPLTIGGTLGQPEGGLEKGALAGRAAAALALGAINPLLALAATIETGPGQDADCQGTLQQAAAPRAQARVERTAPPPAKQAPPRRPDERGTRMGASPAPMQQPAPGNSADGGSSAPVR